MSARNLCDEYEAFLDSVKNEDLYELPKVATELCQNSYAISLTDKKFKKAWKRIGKPIITSAKAKCFTGRFKYACWSAIAYFVNKFTRRRIYVYKVSEDTYKAWKAAQDNPSDESREVVRGLRDCKGRRIYQPIYFRRVSKPAPENGWIHEFIGGWGYWINGVKQSSEVAREHLDEFKNHKKSEAV
jgi:hypothetical protein